MSNRTTLYLLMALAVAAIGLRMWSASNLAAWEDNLAMHISKYKSIVETCDDLELRREEAPKGSDETSFRKHFQRQAHKALMGDVNVSVNPLAAKKTYVDKRFEIEFLKAADGFSRPSLRMFLFSSEQKYPRIRTTALNLRPIGGSGRSRGIEPGVDREDIWEITKLEFRQRTPIGQKN
ncbi:MAG: hypothetical protein QF489_00200 [Planctomycetota bacterium]|jgi:hypothetical protein|nr:hypothetical protein [Planctomycetota bacterium]